MVSFEEFRPSHRNARRHVQRTRLAGLVPILLILLLVSSPRFRFQPGLYAALGLVFAAELILSGAYRLPATSGTRSRPGDRLAASADAWFPFLLFIIQNVHIITTLIVLWITVQRLGMAVGFWQNVLLVPLTLLIPLKRIVREIGALRQSPRWETLAEALTYPLAICVVLMVSSALTSFVLPGYEQIQEHGQGPFLTIWATTIVVVLICLVLFVDKLRNMPTG